jgi:hypothetical protein
VQLWTVAYVDDRQLHAHQFTVAIWVLAWTALRRAESLFDARYAAWIARTAVAAVLLLPGFGAIAGLDIRIAAALYILNLPLLAIIYGRFPVIALGAFSIIAALCCLPADWIRMFIPDASRAQFSAAVIASASIGALGFLRDPRAGFCGSVFAGYFVFATGYSVTLALNASVLFLFLHQLRWQIRRSEKICLTTVGTIWILQTLVLELRNPADARTACFVATIVATLCLRNAALGRPTSLIPPICSIITLSLHPMHWSYTTASAAPSGVLPIVGGFALLALGAWDSTRRSRRAKELHN